MPFLSLRPLRNRLTKKLEAIESFSTAFQPHNEACSHLSQKSHVSTSRIHQSTQGSTLEGASSSLPSNVRTNHARGRSSSHSSQHDHNTEEESRSSPSDSTEIPSQEIDRNNQRRVSDRGVSPPDKGDEQVKKRRSPVSGLEDGLRYGCPFLKNDPRRYSPNKDSKYRPCAGPGFKSISHLK